MRRLNQKSNLSRTFDCSSRRCGDSRIYVNMQSNLIDSNVALHMHLTLSLSSTHVKLDVWTGPKSKHFDITICLICAPHITDLKINVYANEIHQASETLILKNLEADNKTQYLLQNPYMHGAFTLLVVYCIQVLKCRMTRPRNSAHQCLVTKINMTILHLIRNPIFKEQSFECIGNFRRLISTC